MCVCVCGILQWVVFIVNHTEVTVENVDIPWVISEPIPECIKSLWQEGRSVVGGVWWEGVWGGGVWWEGVWGEECGGEECGREECGGEECGRVQCGRSRAIEAVEGASGGHLGLL